MSLGESSIAVSTGFAHSLALSGLFPSPPARLLLVGHERGAPAAALQAQGYEVVTAPLSDHLGFAQYPSSSRQGVYCVDLTHVDAAEVAAVWVLGVSPQVHPLALFDQLSRFLAQDALVLLTGPDPLNDPPRVRRWLEYVVAIGARCGFIAMDVEVDAFSVSSGSFAKFFRKADMPRWQLRHMRPNDYAEIAILFQEVFGHPLSPELWAWKYANGRGNAVLASRNDQLVAHYGGMYREILLCGKPEWAYGGSDVMVHPKERGVMTRQGPFLLTAATTAELYGPVAFGFPTERAMLVAEKMGLYTKAGQMAEVQWQPSTPRVRMRTQVRSLIRGRATDQSLVDALWREMADDLRQSVVGVRDWAFLEYRYFDHPHNKYEVLVVTSRLTGKALGVMVLRRLEGGCELLDVIAPLVNLELVIDQARRMTARWALPYLYCWITANQVHHFVTCGGKEKMLNMYIPTSCWTDDPRVDLLKDKWWLMSGDTDFR